MHRHGRQEPRKVAIQQSFISALLGTLIHIIPVSTIVIIVTLNLRGNLFRFLVLDFLDSSSDWLQALQYVAKVHDLFMMASLMTMVFSVVSSELCLHKGLPYGAIFSGLQISHPTFLWSQEFWGLLTSDEIPKTVILRMGFTIFGAIILGLAVGPASANLMIPRMRTYQVGTTSFWLNATESSLFPAILEGSMVHPSCANLSDESSLWAVQMDACPSIGWEELTEFAELPESPMISDGYLWPEGLLVDFNDFNYTELRGYYSDSIRAIYSTPSEFSQMNGIYNWSQSSMVTTQNAAHAEALFAVKQMWNFVTQSSRKAYMASTSYHTMSSVQPYAAVMCTDSSNLDNFTKYSTDGAQVVPFQDDSYNIYNVTSLNLTELLEKQGNAKNPSLVFVDLTNLTSLVNDLNDVSLGAVIINSDRTFTSCIIHSGWASTNLNISEAFVQSRSDISNMSPRHATISPSWANFLNPIVEASGVSVFDSLLTNFIDASQDPALSRVDFYEGVLGALVANGMANFGIGVTFQGNSPKVDTSLSYSADHNYFIKPSDADAKGWNEWRVKHFVSGLTFSSEGVVIKLSIAVLLVYAALAVTHSLYMLWLGHSSSSWQSVSELTTLALVSQPPEDANLKNTSAGIYGVSVFQKVVRIAVVNKEQVDGRRGEELQLVFGKRLPPGYSGLVPNKEYGSAA